METKYLDIHIIYSDKDKKYLPKLLQQYKKFKIENSIYNWELSLNVHNNSGINNIGQFQRRLEIIKNSPKDHYIWFVDGDDEIIGNADLKNNKEDVDMYIFSNKGFAYTSKGPLVVEDQKLYDSFLIQTTDYNQAFNSVDGYRTSLMELAGGALWSKWIKVKCWDNILEYLDNLGYLNIKPNGSEDCFYCFYALSNAKNIFYSNKPIYFYRNDRSLIFNHTRKIISYKAFLNFRTNHLEITNAIKKLSLPLDNFLLADLCCQTEKALLCIEIKKALQNIVDEFGKDTIINILHEYGDRICLNHPTVKKLAYKYLTLMASEDSSL